MAKTQNVAITLSKIFKNGERDGQDYRKYAKTANVMVTMSGISKNGQRDGHDCRKYAKTANVMVTIVENMQKRPT